jgi:hypothetical protein
MSVSSSLPNNSSRSHWADPLVSAPCQHPGTNAHKALQNLLLNFEVEIRLLQNRVLNFEF